MKSVAKRQSCIKLKKFNSSSVHGIELRGQFKFSSLDKNWTWTAAQLTIELFWTQFKKVQLRVEQQFKFSFSPMNWTWIDHWVCGKKWIELRISVQFWTYSYAFIIESPIFGFSKIVLTLCRLPFTWKSCLTINTKTRNS